MIPDARQIGDKKEFKMAFRPGSSNNFFHSGKRHRHFRWSAQGKLGPRCPPFAH